MLSNDAIDDIVVNEVADVADNGSGLANITVVKDISENNPIQSISGDVIKSQDPVSSNESAENIDYSVFYAANLGNDNNYGYGVDYNDYLKNINKREYVLSPNYDKYIYIKIGQDFTDMYVQCAVHGFIPLGNITQSIPQDEICDLSCGVTDSFHDLNSPFGHYHNYNEVMYYLKHGEYPTSEDQIKQDMDQENYYKDNYRLVDGQKEVYVNIHQDFTDKYIQCMDCGRFFALGNVTSPLRDIMICDSQYHFGCIAYIDIDNPSVISTDDAYNSWDGYLESLYSNPDYRPVHDADPSNDVDSSLSTNNNVPVDYPQDDETGSY